MGYGFCLVLKEYIGNPKLGLSYVLLEFFQLFTFVCLIFYVGLKFRNMEV